MCVCTDGWEIYVLLAGQVVSEIVVKGGGGGGVGGKVGGGGGDPYRTIRSCYNIIYG